MWILTSTGRAFFPLEPEAKDLDIEDIAHALSHLCRFGGHVRKFYSVAQHSVLASLLVQPKEHALAALLHDASEAYLCDVPRPLKIVVEMQAYQAAERRLEALICLHFNVDIYAPAVREIDERLLMTERRDLMHPATWRGTQLWPVDHEQCLDHEILPCGPDMAKWLFLERYKELTNAR